MIIEYYSDVHQEHRTKSGFWYPQITGRDVSETTIVLAGDIGSFKILKWWLPEIAAVYKNVVFVPGNHEYYAHDFSTMRDKLLNHFKDHKNIFVLDRCIVAIDDVLIVGATLWTDFYRDWEYIQRNINNTDNRAIDGFGVYRCGYEFKKTNRYINRALTNSKHRANVVVTHFPPHIDCKNNSKYPKNGAAEAYFYPTVDQELFSMADYWIYGHSHDDIHFEKDGCKVVSHQIGRPDEDLIKQNNNFLII